MAKSLTPRKSSKRGVSARRKPDPARVVYSGVWKIATIIGGTLIAFYAFFTAWVGLGLPKVATYDYVDGIVRPIVSKVDDQGISILQGRIETLKGAKQLQEDAKSRLDLQSHTTKDPIAIQIIQGQQKSIDDILKGIDEQIAKLSAQVQTKK